MRNTIQKQIILNTVRKMRSHPSAEEIYAEIRQMHPNISKATVYRNLNSMAEQGEILRVKLTDGPDRYDFNTERHYHIRCRKCGKIADAPLKYRESLNGLPGCGSGFEADEHVIEFIGLCPDCKRNNF